VVGVKDAYRLAEERDVHVVGTAVAVGSTCRNELIQHAEAFADYDNSSSRLLGQFFLCHLGEYVVWLGTYARTFIVQ
jgi:hypothetical protein